MEQKLSEHIRLPRKTVLETGIWLDASKIVGASLNGLVDEDSVLDVKCPYTERNITIKEAVNTSPNFCLEKTEYGQYALKKEHVYYQGEGVFLSPEVLFKFQLDS